MVKYYSPPTYDNKRHTDVEYFSGSNVKVFFNDTWIPEIVGISYQLQESLQPIYGFNSYTFDRMARGSRIVQGQFSINFVGKGYLQNILKDLSSSQTTGIQAIKPKIAGLAPEVKNLDLVTSTQDSKAKANLFDTLRLSYWGQETQDLPGITSEEYRFLDTHFYGGTSDSLKKTGFTIIIDYSPDVDGVDFQNCLKGTGSGSSVYRTKRILNQVHIQSLSQTIGNDGQVIQEHYAFLAKDVDVVEDDVLGKTNY